MLQFLLCLILSSSVFADVLEGPLNMVNPIDFEQNPTHIEWKKIETEHFEIIFPEEIEYSAQRVAHLVEKAYPYVARSLESLPPKIPLVLQNQSTQSNGFVTLAPRRSEWYVTPAIDPEINNTEWLKTLSIHEFRHVVQFQKSLQGFNKFYYIILGEIGQAVGVGLTMPPWFLEGDAVGTETALTYGGRGRLPLFDRDLRTLLLSGKKFDYDKAHLRSYADYVPSHYLYGYFYTSYLRNQYGDLILSKLVDDASRRSYNPLTFYHAMDSKTGNFEKFYENTMRDLIRQWKEKADALSPTPYEVQNLRNRHGWTNFYFPQKTSDQKIVALKSGLSFIDQFVLINGKKEQTLFYPGPLINQYPYKLRQDKLAFVEWEIDPRWGYRDYSRVKVFDVKKKEMVFDQRKTKFRLAVLNHLSDKILLSEWDEKQGQSLVVMDFSQKEIFRQVYPREEVITSLDWISDDEVVLVLKDEAGFKSLIKYTLSSQSQVTLVNKSQNNLGFVTAEEGHVFYESPESGIDNIFLYTPQGPRQITSALFGAYAPHLKNGELIYNDYTVKGMNVVKKNLRWEEEQKSSDSFVPVYEKFSQKEDIASLESDLLKKENYPTKKYGQFKNALNFHSWMLLAPPLSPSVELAAYSRDILNKFALSFGGAYNLNEHTTQGFVQASWSHLYPVIDLRGAYGTRQQDIRQSGRTTDNRWEEGTIETGIQVPWKKIVGRFTQSFTARAFSKIIKVTNKIGNRGDINDGALYSPGVNFFYTVQSRMARRDLYPQWGFWVNAHSEKGHDISGVDQSGSLNSFDSRIFLPGFDYHHSFFHQIAFERQKNRYYEYPSYIFYPRGTRSYFLQEFAKYSGNYTMPLLTPDWHWSRYLYLKRLSLNLFYDYLQGRYRTYQYTSASTGWEVLLETHILRIFLPITFGIRGSYLLKGEKKSDNYEIFLSQALGVF